MTEKKEYPVKNKVLIFGIFTLELEDLQIAITDFLIELIEGLSIPTEIYFHKVSHNESADGFVVFCVPNPDCNSQLFVQAVKEGLAEVCPELSKFGRFSIVLLEQPE